MYSVSARCLGYVHSEIWHRSTSNKLF